MMCLCQPVAEQVGFDVFEVAEFDGQMDGAIDPSVDIGEVVKHVLITAHVIVVLVG